MLRRQKEVKDIIGFKLFKNLQASEKIINDEITELMKFIKKRTTIAKNVYYIILTYASKGRCNGYILLTEKEATNTLEKEAEILESFVKARLENIVLKRIGKIESDLMIPVPRISSFFR